jgi:hypothetical protein
MEKDFFERRSRDRRIAECPHHDDLCENMRDVKEILKTKMDRLSFSLMIGLFIALMLGAFGFSWGCYARMGSLESSFVTKIGELKFEITDRIGRVEGQVNVNKDRLERDNPSGKRIKEVMP